MEQFNKRATAGYVDKRTIAGYVETVATARHSRRDLAQVALLKGAHQERIMPLLRNCPVLLMAAGEILMRQNDQGESFYVLIDGTLHGRRIFRYSRCCCRWPERGSRAAGR